jgi:anti-sigma factor RsiW
MSDDDAELVALIDNELEESRRIGLMARLAADERLRQRYEELRHTNARLTASFDALLGQVPAARLRAALHAHVPLRKPSRGFAGIAVRELAAGVVIGLLAASAAIGRIDLWAAWRKRGLALGCRRIYGSLYKRNLRSFAS